MLILFRPDKTKSKLYFVYLCKMYCFIATVKYSFWFISLKQISFDVFTVRSVLLLILSYRRLSTTNARSKSLEYIKSRIIVVCFLKTIFHWKMKKPPGTFIHAHSAHQSKEDKYGKGHWKNHFNKTNRKVLRKIFVCHP